MITNRIKCKGNENKVNDHQPKKLLIVRQILFDSTGENIKRVWRICMLILGCKELKESYRVLFTLHYFDFPFIVN